METIFIIAVAFFCIMFAIVGFCLIHMKNKVDRLEHRLSGKDWGVKQLLDLESPLIKMNILKLGDDGVFRPGDIQEFFNKTRAEIKFLKDYTVSYQENFRAQIADLRSNIIQSTEYSIENKKEIAKTFTANADKIDALAEHFDLIFASSAPVKVINAKGKK